MGWIKGTRDDDLLLGTDDDDKMKGKSGDDTLLGGLGDDRMRGQSGRDWLEGGEGNDTLDGNSSEDTLIGGKGHDFLDGGSSSDWLEGNGGRDTLEGSSSSDTLLGGGGKDLLLGGSGADSLNGGGGDDTLDGGSGADTLHGRGGDDILDGGSSGDELNGGKGNDLLLGGSSGDNLLGGDGDDTLDGGIDDDTLDGGAGDDDFLFDGDSGEDLINGFNPGEGDKLFFSDLDPGDMTIDLVTNGVTSTEVSFVDGPTIMIHDFNYMDFESGKATTFFQGFETDTDGWFDATTPPPDDWYGGADRVASGTDGITSSDGDWHAVFTQSDGTGPFTRFDGYRDAWPGEWCALVDIYLDTDMTAGDGFDYSVASNGSDGAHQRDFIFHVAKDISEDALLVGGSNNTSFDPRQDLETINHYEVTESGWYTFEHVFREDGGQLAVDLNLYDDEGNLLFTETRTDASDTIPAEVGGNRYGWFTNVDVDGGIAVDNTELQVTGEGEWYEFV